MSDDIEPDWWYYGDPFTASDERKKILDNFDKDLWTTRDMATVKLSVMSDNHLHNCISYIWDNGVNSCFGLGGDWLPKLNQELIIRSIGITKNQGRK